VKHEEFRAIQKKGIEMNLPTKTITDIRAMKPCYDPAYYLPEDWQGTALDILQVTDAPAKDRLWVVLHEGWIDDRTLRLFAVWCARWALQKINDPDPRSIEVAAARTAAGDAAWAAARAAAGDEQVAQLIKMLKGEA
jgi:hypothetical protein